MVKVWVLNGWHDAEWDAMKVGVYFGGCWHNLASFEAVCYKM